MTAITSRRDRKTQTLSSTPREWHASPAKLRRQNFNPGSRICLLAPIENATAAVVDLTGVNLGQGAPRYRPLNAP
ncbi:hypothetical protein MPL3365_170234 [Mesorhizobium plurifarium]|uniref:Uncharacterized protein n=1 Tax=Mesorhizobium plurifarium TaxID=69974 RepID=A0A090FZL7_MESPL|nr:hypothetical protein MPL3365_170234 [Mesorhizobium plurifarium]